MRLPLKSPPPLLIAFHQCYGSGVPATTMSSRLSAVRWVSRCSIPLSECVTNSHFFRHICQSVEVYFQRLGCRCRYTGRRSLPISATWWTWSVRETRNVFEGATLIWQPKRGHPGEPPEWPLLNDLSLARSVNRLTWIYFYRPGVNPPL